MESTLMTSEASSEQPPVANPPLTRPHFNESYIHLTDEKWLAIKSECQLGAQLVESLTFIGMCAGIGNGDERRARGAASLKTLMVGLDRIVKRRFVCKAAPWIDRDGLPMVEIIDLLTGERTQMPDHSFAGGFESALWCLHQLMRVESEAARA